MTDQRFEDVRRARDLYREAHDLLMPRDDDSEWTRDAVMAAVQSIEFGLDIIQSATRKQSRHLPNTQVKEERTR
jgi:hypothetical protein